MDLITSSLLNTFVKEHQLDHLPKDKQFEHFVTYLIVRGLHASTVNTDELVTGSGDDTGIDSIAVIVNGVLITEVGDFEELAAPASSLDVTFIFIQAVRSPHFESAKMGTFGDGVVDFFADEPKLPRNQQIKDAAQLMQAIYANAGKFGSKRPDCRMFYVTTGKWSGDQQLEARRNSIIADVAALEYFNAVTLVPVGAVEIQKRHDQLKNAIKRELNFERKATLPTIAGVTEAHLGLISGSELLGVIKDPESNDIVNSIFYDNVRDWLGENNQVNSEIRETLASGERYRFSLMNNGVTIIARNLTRTGDTFHIRDFQVVNGCQTCHVLYEVWKGASNGNALEGVWVPLRLIGTNDEDVINAVVKATNRQTPVTEEQFFALQEFPKQLEKFLKRNNRSADCITSEGRDSSIVCLSIRLGLCRRRQ